MPAILTTPSTIIRPSLQDDILFVVYDGVKANDPVTYPDYRYICDVYNGDELVARLKAYPQPDTKFGVFNISNVLRNYCIPILNPDANTFVAQTMSTGDWNISGTCIFGEEYDFVQFLNVSGDTGVIYYNHYNGRKLGTNSNFTNEVTFKSERPRVTSIHRETGNCFIPYLNASLSNNVQVTVTLYDSNDSVLATKTAAEVIPVLRTLGIVNIGIDGINAFMTGTGSVTDSTAYYIVTLASVLQPSQTIRVNLLCESKYEVYTVHFLNRWGGWETQDFTKRSNKSIEITKSDFGKLPYTISAAGVPEYYNSNNVYNETRSVYASQYKEKLTLNSDNLSDDEYIWLQDLVLSPMVFIEMDSGSDTYFIPCVITDTNYDIKKGVNEKTSNLIINIEFGDRFNAQYR